MTRRLTQPCRVERVAPTSVRERHDLGVIARQERALRVGDKGVAVADIQLMLDLEPTGHFDDRVRVEVEKFQVAEGLEPEKFGHVDADTLRALFRRGRGVSHRVRKVIGDVDLNDKGHGLEAHKRIFAAEMGALSVATLRNGVEAVHRANVVGKTVLESASYLASAVLLPATAYYAARDVSDAVRDNKDAHKSAAHKEHARRTKNRAIGSLGYLTSVSAGTLKEVAKVAVSAESAVMRSMGESAAHFVPGLNIAVAAGDVVWATTVIRDPTASKKKRAAACVSAFGSLLSMVTPPPISWVASGIGTGGLLASNFL